MEQLSILFYVDEDLPRHHIGPLLIARGHQVHYPVLSEKDPAIVASAEASGAVIDLRGKHIYIGQ
jgi:hypothetical protein